jgi:hypothetical protein
LPFGELAEDGVGWEAGASGLQVVAVVDLDGDGVQEVLWLAQQGWGDPFITSVELSYFDGERGFAIASLAGCSYNGCDAFIPARACRGVTKPKTP